MEITASSNKPLWIRFFERGGSFGLVGVSTFLLDLGLLYILTRWLHIDTFVAIGLAFMMAVHINYLVLRFWVYQQSQEKMSKTYTCFISLALIATWLIPTLTLWLENTFHWDMFVSRVIIGTLIGIFGFCFNTFLNFKLL